MNRLPKTHGVAKTEAARHAHGMQWLMGFGVMGLFAISAIDSSIIPLPLPGSTDLLLILLVAHRANPILAAFAAIAGSVFGGYFTLSAGAKGGEAAFHRYLPQRFSKRLSGWVEKNGTLAVAVSAVLPPPFPLMPLLLAAGALGVSRKKFFISFGLARGLRYTLVAWLAATYGRAMVRAFRHYLSGWSTIFLWIYLGALTAGILYGIWKYRRKGRQAAPPQNAALSAKV